jgi:collagen type I alpha
MSGSTIGSFLHISVTVGSAGYDSPLTILPVTFPGAPPNPPTITGGFIDPTAGVGIYSDLTNATILNQGMVYGANGPPLYHAAAAAANGVDLFGGGTLTNEGLIGGGGATIGAAIGVSVASSTLFNESTAAIRGGFYGGAGLAATASYILNAGDISGGFESNSTTAGVGVMLTSSTLINTGSIFGDSPGLGAARLYDGSTLVNSGRISGPASAWAVYVASGSVTNTAGGVINPSQSAGQGVELRSGATLVNEGFIGLPPNYSIVGSVGGTGVLVSSGALLSNTGTIDGIGSGTTLAGGTGVAVVGASFTNDGIITGGAGDGSAQGTPGYGTVPGLGGAGLSLDGGSVTNDGLIAGGQARGIGTSGAISGPGVLVIAGTLTNNANISGGGNPLVHGPLGGPGVYLQSGSVVNDGTISGGPGDGAPGVGAEISGGSLTNNAILSGSTGVEVVPGGAGGIFIDNTDVIAGFSGDGVSMAAAARVVNSGMISGPTIAVAMSAVGSLTNTSTGTLVGGAGVTTGGYGVSASAAVTVVNLGKIAMGYIFGTGVDLTAGGTVVNGSPTDNTASVAGGFNGSGIVVTGGSLLNYGVVTTGGFSPGVPTAGVMLIGSSGTNAGTIVGGAGSAGHGAVDSGFGQVGYAGGAGVVLTNSTLTNSGTAIGGVGGQGGYGVYGGASAPGGPGGLGAVVDGGMLDNTGLLLGGAGGPGGAHGINSGEIANSPNGPGGGGVSVTAGLLLNAGTAVGAASTSGGVTGGYGAAVSGGTLINTGLVAGGAGTAGLGGTGLLQSGGTANNTGSIVGGSGTYAVAGGTGVSLTGGSFTNTGLVAGANAGPGGFYSSPGGTGLYLTGATATNAGTIIGGAEGAGLVATGGAPGAAVVFGPAAATLIVDPGAVFSGNVNGNSAVSDELLLGAGFGPGTLEMGSSFSSLSVLDFAPGSDWTLHGGLGPLASGDAIDGFAFGETIVVEGFIETGYTFVSGTGLELSGTTDPTLAIAGDFSTINFKVTTIGTDTRISLACYVAGTRIATTRGKISIEDLFEGDLVLNSDGEAVPVRWIGHRRVDCRRHPHPAQVWPVRVSAGAFAAGSPERDLWLSADHAVFVDDVMIPIKHLINGTTVARVPVDAVIYYHVELPRHDAILAEGLAAESYLDTGGRAQFANGGEVIRLLPDFSARGPNIAALWEAYGFAPLVVCGPIVDSVRTRLWRRAEEREIGRGRIRA